MTHPVDPAFHRSDNMIQGSIGTAQEHGFKIRSGQHLFTTTMSLKIQQPAIMAFYSQVSRKTATCPEIRKGTVSQYDASFAGMGGPIGRPYMMQDKPSSTTGGYRDACAHPIRLFTGFHAGSGSENIRLL